MTDTAGDRRTSRPDPDPLHVDEDDLWDPQIRAWVPRPSAAPVYLAGVLVGLILGLLLGIFVATRFAAAAPRPAAQTAIPTVVDSLGMAVPSAPSGNLAGLPTGAPRSGSPVEVLEAEASGEAPDPAGGVGVPLISEPAAIQAGLASWCAPTPKYCHGWGGDAHLAAVPVFRYGDEPYTVVVRFGGRQTTVTVVSFCACGNKIIDLSPSAFDDLAPLSRGVIPVSVEDARVGTPPPTDVEP